MGWAATVFLLSYTGDLSTIWVARGTHEPLGAGWLGVILWSLASGGTGVAPSTPLGCCCYRDPSLGSARRHMDLCADDPLRLVSIRSRDESCRGFTWRSRLERPWICIWRVGRRSLSRRLAHRVLHGCSAGHPAWDLALFMKDPRRGASDRIVKDAGRGYQIPGFADDEIVRAELPGHGGHDLCHWWDRVLDAQVHRCFATSPWPAQRSDS